MFNKKNKNKDTSAYDRLKAALKSGELDKCYIFHGEEQYMLRDSLRNLRKLLCPGGLDAFNYKRFDTGKFSMDMFEEAIDTLPVFAEKTMIEVHEHDIFTSAYRERLCDVLADLPDHVCIVFVYTAAQYKPDGRLKTTKTLLKYAEAVEFGIQEQNNLIKWITRHVRDAGKEISHDNAAYLVFITGGVMTALHGEIRKVTAYAKGDEVTRSDIDAVALHALDAMVYMLTDAIVQQSKKQAMQFLDTLLQMREAPHKLIFSISLKMRQLMAARICVDNKIGKAEFMKMCGIYHDFQASALIDTARNTTPEYCREAVLLCAKTAKELNSMSDPESRIVELVARLSLIRDSRTVGCNPSDAGIV